MSEHPTSERLHDLLDGLLEGVERDATERHLEGCATCADRLAELTALLDALGGLPSEARPVRDLWPEIADRIADRIAAGQGGGGGGGPARVLAFPAAGRRDLTHGRRRVSATVPQLAAAAVLVSLLSAGSAWWALSRSPGAVAPVAATAGSVEAPVGRVVPAAMPLDVALGDLEMALTEGRDLLDPETLAVLEESLAAIDQAILEAREALASDPNSELLNRLLINHQRAKLRVLQQATAGLIRT